MVGNVVIDEAGHKEVGVVVARLHAQLDGVARLLGGGLQSLRHQLRDEVVRRTLRRTAGSRGRVRGGAGLTAVSLLAAQHSRVR